MVEKNVGKGRRQRVMSCFILERGSFFPPPGIEKPGLVVPYRQSFEKHSAHYQSLLVHRRIYPRFSTIFHHFEYNGEGEECAARNFPSGKSGKAGEKKIGVDRGGNNDALENYLRDKARDAQTYPLLLPPLHLPPRSTFHARHFFPRPSITNSRAMDSSEGTRDALRIKDLKKKCAHANEERVIRAVKISFRKLEKCKTCRVFQIDGDGEMMENGHERKPKAKRDEEDSWSRLFYSRVIEKNWHLRK